MACNVSLAGVRVMAEFSIRTSTCGLKILVKVPSGPLIVIMPPEKVASVLAGNMIGFFAILDMILIEIYQILKRTSPPTLFFLASVSVMMPFGVEKKVFPKPLL